VNLIDAAGGPIEPDMNIVVVGKRITAIEKSAGASVPKNAQMIDGRGKYLIPGLWDMHVHEIFDKWLPENEKVIPLLFVANGITGVRDMGGDLEPLKKWRARAESGDLLAPRMVIAGPMLDGPVPHFPSSAPVKDAADGRRIVDELKKNGADFIKIQSLVPRDGYFAAAEEANRIGIVFAGHVPDAVRASEASNAGQKSIEHFTGVFEGCSTVEDELMKAPRGPGRRKFLSTYDPQKAKALIALQTATRNAGQYLGLSDTGTIETGKRADLVLLDANPLEHISNTQKIRAVVLAGRYLSRSDLDGLLHEVELAAAQQK
jgi:N-acyl-D-aspartate/D-glutamate deacylase